MLKVRLLLSNAISPLFSVEQVIPQAVYDEQQCADDVLQVVILSAQYCLHERTTIPHPEQEVVKAIRELPISEVTITEVRQARLKRTRPQQASF